MTPLFGRTKSSRVRTLDKLSPEVDTIQSIPLPAHNPESFGDDINLIRLVLEHGERQKKALTVRKNALQKQLDEVSAELDAVTKLVNFTQTI